MSENNEQKSRNSKKKKKKVSIFKVLILMFFLIVFITGGALTGWVYSIVKNSKDIDFNQMYTLLDENSFIYDSEGALLEKVEADGLRTIVKYDEIPTDLKNAFLAIEDKDFFKHNGINPKRIVKALWEDIKAGAKVQGASTITQQLVKNLYLSNDKTFERKIREAYYAISLDRLLEKEEILTAYLNTAYLGGGAKGVQGAAYTYFSKDLSELDLAECALLAGITKNPSRYSPLKTLKKEDIDPNKHYIINDDDEIYTIVYDERYKPRQKLVLDIMKSENMITEEEYIQALNEDIKTHLKPGKKQLHAISSFFTDQVKNDVVTALMTELGKTEEEAKNMLYNQGLRIHSTIDLRIQKILEEEYKNSKNFPNLIARKDKYGNMLTKNRRSILLYKHSNMVNNNSGDLIIPKHDFKYDESGNLVLLKGRRLNFTSLFENGEVVGIKVSVKDTYKQNEGKEFFMLKGGNVGIPAQYKRYDGNKNVIVSKEFLTSNPQFFRSDGYGNLAISKNNYYISDKSTIQPQSAMVIIDHSTGEIKGLVGGRSVTGRRLYNRAINPRQPGSAIKPISVYTPALDNGWTAADVIDDVPYYDRNGRRWPRNWYRSYRGLSTLREGVKSSMNVTTVKLAEQIGINTSIDYLKKMGITTIQEDGAYSDQNLASMGLGGMSKGISPLELTAAYGSLANKGVYIKPKSFTKITDRDGNIILENTGYKNLVVNPGVAFIITDMMKDVVSTGTGTRARIDKSNSRIPVAGKTGTTSDNYDAWFAGYTPYYSAAVWIGNDVHMELNSGSRVSAQLWSTVMKRVHEGLAPKKFVKPKDVISIAVDTKSGKLPTELSRRAGTVKSEYFVKGTQPKKRDDVHVELEIDTTTNKLATPYCPTTSIEKRIFTKRPIPYDPGKHGGIVPKDFVNEAPTQTCDVHNEFTNDTSDEIPSIDELFPPNEWDTIGTDNNNNTENNEPINSDNSIINNPETNTTESDSVETTPVLPNGIINSTETESTNTFN